MFFFFWIALAAIFLILELLTTGFFMLFFGLAASAIAVVSYFCILSFYYQFLLFLLGILCSVWLTKAICKKNNHKPDRYALVGECGIAKEDISEKSYGRVLIRDTIWMAKATHNVTSGAKIKVIAQNNLTLEIE